jgi:hypothetical protein
LKVVVVVMAVVMVMVVVMMKMMVGNMGLSLLSNGLKVSCT